MEKRMLETVLTDQPPLSALPEAHRCRNNKIFLFFRIQFRRESFFRLNRMGGRIYLYV